MLISVSNAHCRVTGDFRETAWLKSLLTFEVPGAKYSMLFRKKKWDGKKRFFDGLTKTFPVGLLDYVLKNAVDQKVELLDNREFPLFDDTIPELKGIELRDYQINAIRTCFANKNCLIQAATNAGKTAIFSAIAKQMAPLKCLILTHRQELATQLRYMVSCYTGMTVGIIGSKEVEIRNITVAMVPTLVRRLGSDVAITEYFDSVHCLIADECHHLVAPTWAGLFSSSQAPYRFGFSGTIPAESTFEGINVRQWVGPVALKISNDELIQQEVSAKPLISIYEIDSHHITHSLYQEAKEALEGKFKKRGITDNRVRGAEILKEVFRLTMQRAIVENKERNGKLLDIIAEHPNKSTLIVVDSLEHGDILVKLLADNNINSAFIHGQAEIRSLALQSFKQGLLKVLISTMIIDEGIDISRIEVLVLAAGKKSKRQLLQRIGRGLRKKDGVNEVNIFDFADFGIRYLEDHTRARIKIYKDEGFQVKFL